MNNESIGFILDAVPDIGDKRAREITIARAAYEHALKTTWQPIETAPKDGTRVLLYSERESRICEGSFRTARPWRGFSWPYVETPTHWMPLPAPPKP